MDIIPAKKSKLLYQKGDLKMKGIVDLRRARMAKENSEAFLQKRRKSVLEIVRIQKNGQAAICRKSVKLEKHAIFARKKSLNKDTNSVCAFTTSASASRAEKLFSKNIAENHQKNPTAKPNKNIISEKLSSLDSLLCPKISLAKNFLFFSFFAGIVASLVFSMSLAQKEIEKKNRALAEGAKALEYLKDAKNSISSSDFEDTIKNLSYANSYFSSAKSAISDLGMGISGMLNSLPINTPISTAKNIASAGENISLAGKEMASLLENVSAINKDNFSIEQIYPLQDRVKNIASRLSSAERDIINANGNYVPEEHQNKLSLLKYELPLIAANFRNLDKDFSNILKMLGSENRRQKYLVLFENNTEMRASGGFIGSYAIIDIENGKIANLFIDGIFNPDGQLKEKIIPPMPIQKISAAWSMHDANWFADFPLSAKKVALMYEKTGGPTVDGVIALTPAVMESMLEVTGNIEMPEYSASVGKDNFLQMTQLQVELLYDKKENRPKKFLADIAPKVLEKLLDSNGLSKQDKTEKYLKIAEIIENNLKKKHIVLYHRDTELENMIMKRGWGGQILNSSGDYLSVVNSNVNGYKTDAVIDETIDFFAEIMADGSIVDTVKITRVHNGGDSEYDWYNRVNADYMRVYVPLGSVLLEARGHTLEDYEPPIDYADFKRDEDVVKIENTMKIDPESKTQIFEESGKTVFANWVYVSPKEKVEVVYRYKLPYKINFDDYTKPAEKYSVLFQKQLGSAGSKLFSSIKIPINWKVEWASEGLQNQNQSAFVIETDLSMDRVLGAVFTREVSNM